jgi:Tol biopolymer transport system component
MRATPLALAALLGAPLLMSAVSALPLSSEPARTPQAAAPSAGSPLSTLPSYMKVLLPWGQRPEWDREGRVVFMEKAFGDAYRVDPRTRELTPLTTHYTHEGYDRVLVLANGDFLLTGPPDLDAKDAWKDRHTRFEMFVLDRSLTKPPVALGERIDEGPAVSRTRLHIAWTPPGQRDIYEADIVYADGKPSLANKRLVLSYGGRPMSERLEPQDFRAPGERELLFSCYSGTLEEPFYFSDVCGVDLASGRVTNYSNTPQQYDEVEGIFPDGRHTLVESDRHGVNKQWKIDIYRLPLDGRNTADRITHFDGIPGGYHGSNPVVSDDGRQIVIQVGIHGGGAGQGRGLVLVDVAAWERSLLRR